MALTALGVARESFDSVSADLMFGTPGDQGWIDSVRGVIATDVDHLSLYALTVERGTALSRAITAGAPAPDPDEQADCYLAASALAEAAGLLRYETSNFARPGQASVYNLITWAQGEYAAFGNGAHRHRNGERSWNVRRVDRYEERALAGRVLSPIGSACRCGGARWKGCSSAAPHRRCDRWGGRGRAAGDTGRRSPSLPQAS